MSVEPYVFDEAGSTAVKIKIGLSAETFYRGKLKKTVCRYSNPKSYHEKRHISRIHIWNSSNFFDSFSFLIFSCFAVEKVDRALFHFSKLFQTSKNNLTTLWQVSSNHNLALIPPSVFICCFSSIISKPLTVV